MQKHKDCLSLSKKGFKVFISYSHTDEQYCKELITHLSALKRSGFVNIWNDRDIIPGVEWDKCIKKELLDSEIILLLVSSDFIASDYCFDIEIQKAMEKHNNKTAFVIPIIVRPCDWKNLPFSKIQGLPENAKPITTWNNTDEAYLNIIEGIKKRLNESEFTNDDLIHLNTNNEENNEIMFNTDIVLCKLPRGYIVIDNIEYRTDSQWGVTVGYYNYNGEWLHGTHYHDSYRRYWETLEGIDNQCKKLFIPIGDWVYASPFIEIIMRIRERQENETILDIINLYDSDNTLINFFTANTIIKAPKIPKEYNELNKTGELRDIITEIYLSLSTKDNLEELHERFESLRRSAQLIIFDLLSKDHLAYKFVEEISNSYDNNFTFDELRKWDRRLSDAIFDTFKYIK